MPLTVNNELGSIRRIPVFGRFFVTIFQNIEKAVNNLGTHVGADPTGSLPPPPVIDGVNVKASGGLVHITLTHNAPIRRNIQYHVEAATEPNFLAPHPFDLGSSRVLFATLPAKNDAGDAQSWYFRAFPQYLGSKSPAVPTNYGGVLPAPVNVGGTVQLTPLQSTGSGTASPNGTQGGWGLGKVLYRPALGPKRA